MSRPFSIARMVQQICGLMICFIFITAAGAQAQTADSAKDCLKRANASYEHGELDSALADYSRAIARNPFLAEAYAGRGRVWFRKGNLEQAIADYSAALEIGHDSAATYYNRGLARSALGDLKGAIDDYEKAISAAPRFARAYAERGLARLLMGKEEGARRDFRRCLKLDPDLKPQLETRIAEMKPRNEG
jgi:tetratricopeptide (TPR) repeat protein